MITGPVECSPLWWKNNGFTDDPREKVCLSKISERHFLFSSRNDALFVQVRVRLKKKKWGGKKESHYGGTLIPDS